MISYLMFWHYNWQIWLLVSHCYLLGKRFLNLSSAFGSGFTCPGGYGEALSVQQNRKDEGEKMKRWAEAAWRNRRLSLAEALEISEPSLKLPVIDTRICRAL